MNNMDLFNVIMEQKNIKYSTGLLAAGAPSTYSCQGGDQ